MTQRNPVERAEIAEVGLCSHCRHARIVTTPRSRFWLCKLSAINPCFDKYPRLPVLKCSGHEPGAPEAVEHEPPPERG